MLKIIKGYFYLSFSTVLILSYFSITSYFVEIENKKFQRQDHLDKYYSKEFETSWHMCSSDIESWVTIGEESLEKAKCNAAIDGYDRADIELMSSVAFKKSLEIKELLNSNK